MIQFVNAKINLGLSVVRRRPDGYHDLSTIFYPIGLHAGTPASPDPFADALEIIPSERNRFIFSGNPIDCPLEKNLVYKAFMLFSNAYRERAREEMKGFEVHLDKHLPDGAGLGGGSADASFTLLTLNKIHASLFSAEELIAMAAKLGADCPFFILNRPCAAEGIGEILEPVALDLSGITAVVAKPKFGISTREAFGGITPRANRPDAKNSPEGAALAAQLSATPIADWKELLTNDFEAHLFQLRPQLAEIKSALYGSGALYAQMSGSGSALFGLYSDSAAAAAAAKELAKGGIYAISTLL